jgi:N(2)-fixation sustaining protein CowN
VGARKADELCLACSNTYYIEELFEAAGDEMGLAALRRLEDECC